MSDHAAEARTRLGWTEDWQSREGDSDATQIATVLAAQVHATLALAEQQRIANLIALATPQKIPGQGKATISIPSYGTDGLLRADIASALGLTPSAPASES